MIFGPAPMPHRHTNWSDIKTRRGYTRGFMDGHKSRDWGDKIILALQATERVHPNQLQFDITYFEQTLP